MVLRIIAFGWLVLSACVAAQAASDDVRGGKDHPLLTRYPDSKLLGYERNFNAVDLATGQTADGAPVTTTVEGDVTVLTYFYKDIESQPSPLQLLRNYQGAIKAIGGQMVFERKPKEGDGGEMTFKVSANTKDFWIKVEPDVWSAPTHSYKLTVVEVAAMAQVVSANAMLDALNKDGFIALYITFDTGKSEIKSDGVATVAEIVSLLKASPNLALSIEGHTDNVGGAGANLTLSAARAQAVREAIVKAGIDAGRLTSKGHGQSVPIADNRSEEGRAKNRRVELVKR